MPAAHHSARQRLAKIVESLGPNMAAIVPCDGYRFVNRENSQVSL